MFSIVCILRFCIVLCTFPSFLYSCLFLILVQVYWPLPSGGNTIGVNKHHILILYQFSGVHQSTYFPTGSKEYQEERDAIKHIQLVQENNGLIMLGTGYTWYVFLTTLFWWICTEVSGNPLLANFRLKMLISLKLLYGDGRTETQKWRREY